MATTVPRHPGPPGARVRHALRGVPAGRRPSGRTRSRCARPATRRRDHLGRVRRARARGSPPAWRRSASAPGDTVAIMLLNRPEFHLVDTAALHLGATPFSVYNTSSPEQIEYLFGNAGNRVVVTERSFRAASSARPSARRARRRVDGGEGTISLDGWRTARPTASTSRRRGGRSSPTTSLTLIYTSGTTGPPKGVELTHANMLAELRGCSRGAARRRRGGRATSYLPAAHIADRWASHYHGRWSSATRSPRRRPADGGRALPEVRPTVWGAVPRFWEKLKAALEAQGITRPGRACRDEAKAAVRATLGLDRGASALVVGAAPIAARGARVLRRASASPICELWGMSETSCCAHDQSARRDPDRHRRAGHPGRRAEPRRGRRAAGARRARDARLPRRPGEDRARRSTTTAGCTPATSRRSTTTAT